jgi:hypothetical protein
MSESIAFSAGENFQMEPQDLPDSYRELLAEMRETTDFVVIGAVAVALRGGRHVTRDVDAIVRDSETAIQAMYKTGFRVISRAITSEPNAYIVYGTAEDALLSIKRAQSIAIKALHKTTGLEFDVWLQSPDETKLPLESIFAHAQEIELAGHPTKCASAADMIVMKKIALAANPDRARKDEADIAFLESLLQDKSPEEME